jgi:hypothetical protein
VLLASHHEPRLEHKRQLRHLGGPQRGRDDVRHLQGALSICCDVPPGTVTQTIRCRGANTPDSYLTLGYSDDSYSDNGYWGHDDGTENQCAGIGNAVLEIYIEHH